MKQILCTFLFCYFTITASAQADSLKKRLALAKEKEQLTILTLLIKEDPSDSYINYYSEGRALAKKLNDIKGEIEILEAIGDRKLEEQDTKAAATHYKEGLSLARKHRNTGKEISCLNKLANLYAYDLDFENAEKHFNDALALGKRTNDISGLSTTLESLGIFYVDRRDYNKALECFSEELRIDRKLGDSSLVATCFNNIGLIHYYRGEYQNSIASYQKALTIKRSLNEDEAVAQALLNIGISYRELGIYDRSLSNLLDAARVFEKKGSLLELASCYNTIGNIHIELKSLEKALTYHTMSLNIREKIGYKRGIAGSLNNIGNVYKQQGKYNEALDFLARSLKIKEEIGDKKLVASTLDHIGDVYQLMQKPVLAEQHYLRSIELKQQVEDPKGMAITLNSLGNLSLSMKQYNKALIHLEEGRQIAIRTGARDILLENYEHTAKAYRYTGSSEQAYNYYELHAALKDSILNEQKNKALAEMQVKYETERKEQEILLLNEKEKAHEAKAEKQRVLIYSLSGGGILLIVITLVSLKAYRTSRKASKQREVMMQELHHRVKNNLQVLSSLLSLQKNRLTDETTRDALKDVDHRLKAMMLIHQDLYGKKMISRINMKEYVSRLISNLLMSFGYSGDDVSIQIEATGAPVDPDKALSLGFIINEVVSNSLKHAFHNSKAPVLSISIHNNEQEPLRLTVSDNGKGLPPDLDLQKSDSFGLRLVYMFLKDLKGKVYINTENGTRFDFIIPN